MGIKTDFIVARSEKYLDQRRRDRFALFCNMHEGDIISNPDMGSAYEIPLTLQKQELEKKILKKLHLPVKSAKIAGWEKLVEKIKEKKKIEAEIAIVGKYF